MKQRKITELFKPKEIKPVKQDDVKTCTSNERNENNTRSNGGSETEVRTTIVTEPAQPDVEFGKTVNFSKQVKTCQD